MLAVAAPLLDATNHTLMEASTHAEPSPLCFLSLLAEASLERLHDAKRAKPNTPVVPGSLECGECVDDMKTTHAWASLETTTVRPRCPSRHSVDVLSSRSTSPQSGASASGKSYLCNHCAREYASTDAVRKHARQNHPEWLKEQGQGCPSLYCTAVESTGPASSLEVVGANLIKGPASSKAASPPTVAVAHVVAIGGVAGASAAMPAPIIVPAKAVAAPNPNPVAPTLSVSAAAAAGVPPPAPSPADLSAAHLLMTAAESCLALSMAAHADDDADADLDDYAARADRLAAFMASHEQWPAVASAGAARGGAPAVGRQLSTASAGNKRPRSVRCGNCDGCTRDDCGSCKNCVDKPKFGGLGQRKQGCVRKICSMPRVAV